MVGRLVREFPTKERSEIYFGSRPECLKEQRVSKDFQANENQYYTQVNSSRHSISFGTLKGLISSFTHDLFYFY